MADSNFIDQIRVQCRSGKGGAGAMHLHRDKFTRKGGPDGGNGGRGGHIILKGNSHLWTLLHLRYQKHIFADDGTPGSKAQMTGADGIDTIIEVPLGTIVKDEDDNLLFEITTHNETKTLLPGGRGGMGNSFFKSSTNRTPRFSQPGEPGIEKMLTFEIKLLADVGLVGFPNAGKSTLLSTITAAKPEIADYPFTTLTPNLGIVPCEDNRSFVMADIPGIIEGAHEGKGLGLRFLRHIERNSVLLFMVPADTDNIINEYKILISELEKYNPELLDKKRLLAISKCDLLDDELLKETKKNLPDVEHVFISSFNKKGLLKLKGLLWKLLNN